MLEKLETARQSNKQNIWGKCMKSIGKTIKTITEAELTKSDKCYSSFCALQREYKREGALFSSPMMDEAFSVTMMQYGPYIQRVIASVEFLSSARFVQGLSCGVLRG
tara:strand:- start:497 stop:817 length:321 start_codon:yes stop_codon:yes gene_type:complete